nr:thioesterase family protein [Moraxella osloensis]
MTDTMAKENDEHSDLANESQLQLNEDSEHHAISKPSIDVLGQQLANIMSQSPFVAHTFTTYHYEAGKVYGKVKSNPALIGNPNFEILHGGMTATLLDTIGGLEGMLEIYRRDQGTFEEQTKKIKRMATVDLRVDYLAPGRGHEFMVTAEVIRMGRKGCTTRMMLVNDEGKLIAHGIASYAF